MFNASAAQVATAARTSAPQSSLINRLNDSDQTQPIQSSLLTSTRRSQRLARDVDTLAECGICMEALGTGDNVARCYKCTNDFHKTCLAEWWNSRSMTCGYC
jgi:hypothetical protein